MQLLGPSRASPGPGLIKISDPYWFHNCCTSINISIASKITGKIKLNNALRDFQLAMHLIRSLKSFYRAISRKAIESKAIKNVAKNRYLKSLTTEHPTSALIKNFQH